MGPPSRFFMVAVVILAVGCGKGEDAPKGRARQKDGLSAQGGSASRPTPLLQRELRVGEPRVAPPPREAPGEEPLSLAAPAQGGSYRAMRPVAVFRAPDTEGEPRGAIKEHQYLQRGRRVQGKGCPKGFLELGPEAFVCMSNLKPDPRAPQASRQPTVGANGLTPGTYGYIRTGGAKLYWTLDEALADKGGKAIAQSDTVRWAGKRQHGGKTFWRITTGHFIPGDRVRRFWPSKMRGVDLGGEGSSLPLVFMASRRRRQIGEVIPPVDVHARPGGAVLSTHPRYSAHGVDQVVVQGEFRWYRIPGKGWVSSEMVRLARLTDPPAGLHPDERWIDVDVEEQTLVAYRGRAPVYAALVATGVWKYPTPIGLFRITRKVAEADMRSEPSSDETYRVDHVPWTLYFKGGYALHGAYWHDGFGHARSHGCINLSPRDARWLYEFARPVVPEGWTRLGSDAHHPGTAVRIRGKTAQPKAEPRSVTEPKEAERN